MRQQNEIIVSYFSEKGSIFDLRYLNICRRSEELGFKNANTRL